LVRALVACKIVDGKERHFVLVDECYLDDLPFTLFVDADHLRDEFKEGSARAVINNMDED
jgi:hypothetical protein